MKRVEQRVRLEGDRVVAPAAGWLRKMLTLAGSAALLISAFVFSLLLFAVLTSVVMVGGGYLWWRTRELRRQLRERPPGGHVIEGEVVRDSESR